MCMSTNEIERQAYIMCEKIRIQSIYKPISIEFIGETRIELQNQPLENLLTKKDLPLVSKVILEDGEGVRFDVEPTEIGLSCAKGEITFTEYRQLQTKESYLFIGYLIALSSGFLLLSWALLRLFFM